MKQYTIRKRNIRRKTLAVCILTLVLLSGCGKEEVRDVETPEAEDISGKEEEPAAVEKEEKEIPEEEADREGQAEEPEEENKEEKTGEGKGDEDAEKAGLQKYQAALRDLLEKQIYPDGRDCGDDGFYPMSDNKFAVVDVDKDGRKELIISFTTSFIADMQETVYDYDEKTDSLTKEYFGFPGAVFYENGLVLEGLSHNHGMAPLGDFWPYMLHRYDPETDSYSCIFMVDAWEKEYRAEDYEGNPYPEEIDTEKAGIVYFVMEGAEYDDTSLKPISRHDYENWYKEQGLDGAKTEILYQALTEENIGNILEDN